MDCNFLEKTILFRGISAEEIRTMLDCLEAKEQTYQKGSVIFREGDVTETMGLVLSGSVRIENNDIWGNKSILDSIGAGQVFAETYACVPGEPLMVSAVAAEDCRILMLNARKMLHTCPKTCAHHSKLIRNLLTISSQKNLNLSRRIFHTSSKSIRGRLMSYLSDQASRQGSYEFTIPYNRQQLADYLSVDRSALSNELGKMQREGMLKVKKNHFLLSCYEKRGVLFWER